MEQRASRDDEPGAPEGPHPLLHEIDVALSTLENARNSGLRVPDQSLRDRGLSILEFHKGAEENYRLHVELLGDLHGRGLLKQYSIWHVALPQSSICGAIAISGNTHDIAGYAKHTYYLPEAEAFVARRCENNWSRIDAGATTSDTPGPGMGLDIEGAERAFRKIRSDIESHAANIRAIS